MSSDKDAAKIVVICGPTAVGKSDIALKVALDFGMEIVSCDSMQIYKYMDIGSAKPSKEEQNLVPHHMIDVIDPTYGLSNVSESGANDIFSVVNYSEMAMDCIDDIISRGKTPLIVGGTGLYLDSIIYDIDFAAAPSESLLRDELYKYAEENGPEALYEVLKNEDPDAASRIHPNNIKRVVRAIEAAKLGNNIREFKRSFELRSKYDPILIGLSRDREELYDRINQRVDIMAQNGLIDEVKSLSEMGLTSDDYPMKGIGYKELLPIIDEPDFDLLLENAITEIKTNSRHYAKRQFTWFKRYKDMKWFDLTGCSEGEGYNEIVKGIETWLKEKMT